MDGMGGGGGGGPITTGRLQSSDPLADGIPAVLIFALREKQCVNRDHKGYQSALRGELKYLLVQVALTSMASLFHCLLHLCVLHL